MTRIIQQHPTLAVRSLSRLVLAVLVVLLLAASTADAALTTSACLVQKRKAWITFRKCQGTAQVNQIKGKPADLAKCQTTFQNALAKITAKATKAAIPCRYGANGDRTVTDYDTGLQWETKDGAVGGLCLFLPNVVSPCVNDIYSWADAQSFVSGASSDGAIITNFLAGYADWRLPKVVELRTIVDTTVPGCGSGLPCIDPIFGPTVATSYWSATTFADDPAFALFVGFQNDSFVASGGKGSNRNVRAVRTGL